MLIFRATKGQLLLDLMSCAECQNNPNDLNFQLQNSLEIFENNSADKIQQGKGDKNVPLPMPNRVIENQ